MRLAFALAGLVGTVGPCFAQTSEPAVQGFTPQQTSPVRKLLVDGYEIKTGFSDNNGGAYMILQKATSAYVCHSSPNQTCEKLN